MLERTADAGAWLAIDFAYKCQYFEAPPAYYAWSPADHPNVDRHSLELEVGPRAGPAARLDRGRAPVIEAIERVQQCSMLCPDTLSQMAMARYLAHGDRRRVAAALCRQTPTRSIARPREVTSTPSTSICGGRG